MESLLGVAETLSPFPETESARADLRVHLSLYARALRGRAGKLLTGIVAEAQKDPATRDAFIARYMVPRRLAARQLLERGMARGEFRPGLDIEGICDALYGFFYLRLLFGHGPMDDARGGPDAGHPAERHRGAGGGLGSYITRHPLSSVMVGEGRPSTSLPIARYAR